jgi:alginate O-acetyltransferase complex protein AlgI
MRAAMLFHSQTFVLCFLPVFLAGFLLAGRWALHWLIAASLVFYGWWSPAHVPLLVGSILANHAIGLRIHRSGAPRRWLLAGVAGNLALLGWFKYADFLLGMVSPGALALGIVLPLAISFFTFQQIMFLVDCWHAHVGKTLPPSRGGGEYSYLSLSLSPSPCAPPSLLHYAAFVAFFPHLIAGPLVRPRNIVPQLAILPGTRFNSENLAAGLTLFLLGLAKKLVLADLFGGFADTGFDAAARDETLTLLEAWAATLSYALQIYFDFSAYSDMATGLARTIGVRFPLNFDSPYQATDIADFWRRWHITLGSFLRDHVYIPLGGNRHRQAANLMVTMLLAGLWHGAAWRFVLWGGLHGAMLVGHRLYRRGFGPMPAKLGQAITLVLVCLAWVPFRAESMPAASAMTRGLLGLNGLAIPAMIAFAFPALSAIATPVPVLRFLGDARTLSLPEVAACLLLGWTIVLAFPHAQALSDRARGWAITASFGFTVRALFFAPHVAPFLYFQF